MEYCFDSEYKEKMMIVAMFKIFHDAELDYFKKDYINECINDSELTYQYSLDALEMAAPIGGQNENLFQKYGIDPDQDCDTVYSFSSKEMQKYFKIARKLHRLEGCVQKENLYIRHIISEMEDICGFYSWNECHGMGSLRKRPQLEVVAGCEFMEYAALNMWVVRVMELFREKLPELEEKYRQVRRKKRSEKGGMRVAA